MMIFAAFIVGVIVTVLIVLYILSDFQVFR